MTAAAIEFQNGRWDRGLPQAALPRISTLRVQKSRMDARRKPPGITLIRNKSLQDSERRRARHFRFDTRMSRPTAACEGNALSR